MINSEWNFDQSVHKPNAKKRRVNRRPLLYLIGIKLVKSEYSPLNVGFLHKEVEKQLESRDTKTSKNDKEYSFSIS